MRSFNLQQIGITGAPLLLVALLFFMPLSPTLNSTFLGLGSLALISTPYYRRISYFTWNSLSGYLAIGLFAFVIVAALWSPAPFDMRLIVINKYFKLFYLPVVATAFINPTMRVGAINAFILGMLFTALLSILMTLGVTNIFTRISEADAVFYNHIITGFMMAFASYLAALLLLKHQGWLRLAYLLAYMVTSYQVIFINAGRTGYLVYFVLMVLLLVQHLPVKKALAGVVLFCSLFASCYVLSPVMNSQVNRLLMELSQNQEANSVGQRIHFHQYAKSLMKEHPLIGIGTGGFKYRFAQDNPLPNWGPILSEPHSQYWMTLAEQGLVGLILFVAFLGSLVLLALRLQEYRPILLGFVVVFSISCLSDTIFSFSILGYLLIMVAAICFGELHEMRERISKQVV